MSEPSDTSEQHADECDDAVAEKNAPPAADVAPQLKPALQKQGSAPKKAPVDIKLTLLGQINTMPYLPRRVVSSLLGASAGALVIYMAGILLAALGIAPVNIGYLAIVASVVGATFANKISDRHAALPPWAERALARGEREFIERVDTFKRSITDLQERDRLIKQAALEWDQLRSRIYNSVRDKIEE